MFRDISLLKDFKPDKEIIDKKQAVPEFTSGRRENGG